jgi:hypothetical protein
LHTHLKSRLSYTIRPDMLGDIIYEAKGKLTSYRVLDVTEGPKIEVTIAQNGTLRGGIEATDIVTYWSIPRPGGAYYAEGKGVIMVKDNPTEVATWTGQGIAHYSGQKRRDVGSVFFRTPFTTGKLAFLITWLESLNMRQKRWVTQEKYGSGNK